MKIALISCVSKKLTTKAKAKELYISTLFKLNLKFAIKMKSDKIFILSAKYGLLELEDEISPYNQTLNKMNSEERKRWALLVIEKLKNKCSLKDDHFIILAGHKYRQYLLPSLSSYEIPLKGMTIGKQLQFLKNNT